MWAAPSGRWGVVELAAKLSSSGGLQSSGSVTGDSDLSGDSAFPTFGPQVFGLGPVFSTGTVTAGGASDFGVVSGGISSGVLEPISGGVFVLVSRDPIAILRDVDSGQTVTLSSGQSDGAYAVHGGAEIVVEAGGELKYSNALNGGQIVAFGITSAVWLTSGQEIVSSGGVASRTLILDGGVEQVESGGTEVGTTLQGGTLEILSGGTAGLAGSSTTFFWGGGLLKLDDAPAFSAAISGFGVSGGSIDLVNIAVSGASLAYSGTALSGVLTVSDGAHVATLALLGDYTAANFHLADDGHGGTMVTDPPVSSGTALATPH